MSPSVKVPEGRKDVQVTAPDGGWGWIIVLCAVVLNFMIGGAVNTFGVLYVELLKLFQQSASKTAWVGSLANAMGLLLGPMSSALSARFSCRTMVIVGGFLAASGWVLTGFMPQLEYMFLTYGLLAGKKSPPSFAVERQPEQPECQPRPAYLSTGSARTSASTRVNLSPCQPDTPEPYHRCTTSHHASQIRQRCTTLHHASQIRQRCTTSHHASQIRQRCTTSHHASQIRQRCTTLHHASQISQRCTTSHHASQIRQRLTTSCHTITAPRHVMQHHAAISPQQYLDVTVMF